LTVNVKKFIFKNIPILIEEANLKPVRTAAAPGHLRLKRGKDVEEAVAHQHIVVDRHDQVGHHLR
jgi:hypothetical protein